MQARMTGTTFLSGVVHVHCAYRTAHATLTEEMAESRMLSHVLLGRLYAQIHMAAGWTYMHSADDRDERQAGPQDVPGDGRGGSSPPGYPAGGAAPGAQGQPHRWDHPPQLSQC